MPESDFERRLGTLLHETAADIPPKLDVSARVHHRYYAPSSRRWMTAASMVAVVALLAGTFVWFRGFGLWPGPITLHIDGAYADATSTVVKLHFTGPRTDVEYSPVFASLTDVAGNSLPNVIGGGGSGGDAPGVFYELFAPLPQQVLGVRQTLTLTITNLDAAPLNVPYGSGETIAAVKGYWEANIAVTPIAGTSTPLRIDAQTHGNLSLQPLRLDVSPGAPYPGDSYLPGGMRIVLRMSGLTPGATQFPRLATAYNVDPQGGEGPGPGSVGQANDGSQSSLSAAGDPSGILPAVVIVLDAQGLPQQIPGAVDANGAIEFELNYIFLLQDGRQILGLQLRGPLTLTFDSITLSTGQTVQGPWVFTIPNG